jgi:tetratricopeptide (TPR) repeat protein
MKAGRKARFLLADIKYILNAMKMNPKMRGELDRLHSFLQENGKSLPAINRIALLLQQRSYPLEHVLNAYEIYLAHQPDSANAAFNYAWNLARDGQFKTSIHMYRRALELGIEQPEEVHLNIANIYMDHLRDDEKARKELQQALAKNPRYVGAYHNLGNLAEQLGDREQAAAHFKKCLEISPGNESALARLADTHRFVKDDDPLLARLVESARTSSNSDLHYALGAAFNQLADFELAWSHFSKANALDRKILPPYRLEQTETDFSQIMAQCGSEWFARFPGASHQPVFICGMFRTGSTLLEQVLAAHPGFTAGGESEFFPRLVLREFHDYPEGLDEITSGELQSWRDSQANHSSQLSIGSTRFTDKRPDNFLYIGLIKAILPSAKFVVTERDWRDVAISIFSTRMGAAQNYSTLLESIRHYIGLQEQLVDHWESILGDDLIRVRYENLVGQPRETVGNLLDALGEDWDERCLSFDKLDNAVKTASVWQIREPFHTRSIGRWKNYKPYFEEVFGSDLGAP